MANATRFAEWKYFRPVPQFMGLDAKRLVLALAETVVLYKVWERLCARRATELPCGEFGVPLPSPSLPREGRSPCAHRVRRVHSILYARLKPGSVPSVCCGENGRFTATLPAMSPPRLLTTVDAWLKMAHALPVRWSTVATPEIPAPGTRSHPSCGFPNLSGWDSGVYLCWRLH